MNVTAAVRAQPQSPVATATEALAGIGEPAPVVIVGAGPVGLRLAHELQQRLPGRRVVVYGKERWQPYNRVRLSSFLAGELGWKSVQMDVTPPGGECIEFRLGLEVTAIDRANRTVVDAIGNKQAYSHLVLATGSRPVVPEVKGVGLQGVFTFRDLNDAERLIARRVRSRRTVVLGGGLLGLEAARAMRRFNTEVVVIEHTPRLMSRQLDDGAAAVLKAHVEQLGIKVLLGDAVREVLGEREVTGVRLRSGGTLSCDTLIVAAGIRPCTDLAVRSGLVVGSGIKVDDQLCTSDPAIYAAGECAEHRGRVYGLVAPGMEQAAIAAHNITRVAQQTVGTYTGSTAVTRLKVLDLPVFSAGEVGDAMPDLSRAHTFVAPGTHRSVVMRRGRVIGAIAIGNWPELGRLQESVGKQRRLWFWQLARFRSTGRLWPEQQATKLAAWPDSAVVCNCTGITCGTLRAAMAAGCSSAAELATRTGASTVCGTCRPQLQELAGSAGPVEAVRGARWLWLGGATGLGAAALLLLLPGVPYPDTWDLQWRWDVLWRDTAYKQASGFTLLGVMVALAILSLRKRIALLRIGDFAGWRIAHLVLGLAALLTLLVHSGARMGDNLNQWLSLSVLLAAIFGALASAALAKEHDTALARRVRRGAHWMHVVALWPVPVLLLFHVVKTYAF